MDQPPVSVVRKKIDLETYSMDHKYTITIRIPFPEDHQASTVLKVLSADFEKGQISKTLTVQSNLLQILFKSDDLKLLRSVVTSTFDQIELIIQTLEAF